MSQRLLDAAMDERPTALVAALDAGDPIDEPGPDGWTPLLVACREGAPRCAQILVERGADLHARKAGGFGVLHMIADLGACNPIAGTWRKMLKLAEALIAAGADPNAATEAKGQAPLRIAAGFGQADLVQRLLAAPGIDVDRADAEGVTALQAAALAGSDKAVQALLAAGADPRHADESGLTPLHGAAEAGCLPAVKRLVKAGAALDARSTAAVGTLPAGSTPRDVARDLGRTEVEAWLAAKGAPETPRAAAERPPDPQPDETTLARLDALTAWFSEYLRTEEHWQRRSWECLRDQGDDRAVFDQYRPVVRRLLLGKADAPADVAWSAPGPAPWAMPLPFQADEAEQRLARLTLRVLHKVTLHTHPVLGEVLLATTNDPDPGFTETLRYRYAVAELDGEPRIVARQGACFDCLGTGLSRRWLDARKGGPHPADGPACPACEGARYQHQWGLSLDGLGPARAVRRLAEPSGWHWQVGWRRVE